MQPKNYKIRLLLAKKTQGKRRNTIAGLHTSEISKHDNHNDYRAFIKYQNPVVKNSMALLPSEILAMVRQKMGNIEQNLPH